MNIPVKLEDMTKGLLIISLLWSIKTAATTYIKIKTEEKMELFTIGSKSVLGVRRHGLGPAEGRDSSSDDAGADPRPPAVLPVRHDDDEAPSIAPSGSSGRSSAESKGPN